MKEAFSQISEKYHGFRANRLEESAIRADERAAEEAQGTQFYEQLALASLKFVYDQNSGYERVEPAPHTKRSGVFKPRQATYDLMIQRRETLEPIAKAPDTPKKWESFNYERTVDPANKRHVKDELRTVRAMDSVADKRMALRKGRGMLGSNGIYDPGASKRARRAQGREDKRLFKNGTIDARQYEARKFDRPMIAVTHETHFIEKNEHAVKKTEDRTIKNLQGRLTESTKREQKYVQKADRKRIKADEHRIKQQQIRNRRISGTP